MASNGRTGSIPVRGTRIALSGFWEGYFYIIIYPIIWSQIYRDKLFREVCIISMNMHTSPLFNHVSSGFRQESMQASLRSAHFPIALPTIATTAKPPSSATTRLNTSFLPFSPKSKGIIMFNKSPTRQPMQQWKMNTSRYLSNSGVSENPY